MAEIEEKKDEVSLYKRYENGEKLFVHLHNHSHYSLLDGLSKPADMVTRANEMGQPAIALTDHGTMMGIVDFFECCKKGKVKPIIGCEAYVTKESRSIKNKTTKGGFHLVLLAKNMTGYNNLMYLITEANVTGFYFKPRMDHELLEKHSEGLIALSACLGGEVAQAILKDSYEEAKKIALYHEGVFGKGNYYLELQHHEELPEQNIVNKALIKISKETGIGLVATNDAHYVKKEDAIIQDALVCINTGKQLSERENRLCMMNGDYSILTTEQMYEYFKDTEEALSNTLKIADKCQFEIPFDLGLVPVFECPNNMSEKEYLKELCDTGLKDRYGIIKKGENDYYLPKDIDPKSLPLPLDELIERLVFELKVINKMGYPGYFLIVQDFVNWAKENGCLVGPGRGSAAGALVTYLVKITNIDPLQFDLLFVRFLNPDRVSMPDIDIDFQDNKREDVLRYVRDKYGDENVCQVVTYQSMAAKNSIRDIGRVKGIPLADVNKVANSIPSKPGVSLKKAFKAKSDKPRLEAELKHKQNLTKEDIEVKTKELKDVTEKFNDYKEFYALYQENDLNKELIDMARRIEGTIRGTGTHACAVIISGEPVYHFSPLMYPPKDSSSLITQYEGPQLEKIGLLKMDFLGLRNLSIISNCLSFIKNNHNVEIDIDTIPLDDKKSFEIYAKGLTNGIFQFESAGMKKYLKDLKPDRFEDLVAMNALYRPGPLEYIPNYIKRKHGSEPITFDHPIMEKFIGDTYGVTVFQEQVMLQSRALGGFTRGQSDALRKAMGKKKIKLMNELKELFIIGCKDNPKFMSGLKEGEIAENVINKIWTDWESFAKYAFNKSHSVCYAYVSYQTAYLKAHYPVEYMAAMMNSVKANAEKVLEYIGECEKMNIEILAPDINSSEVAFSATKDGKVTFGLSAIKNVGEKALDSIINTRKKDGNYTNIYDFLERIDLSKANKRTIEFLAKAGAMDSLNHPRKQIIESLEFLIPHFQKIASQKEQFEVSLFGDLADDVIEIIHPELSDCAEWTSNEKLEMEKEFTGFYVSGHPLDAEKELLKTLCISKAIDPDIITSGSIIWVGGLLTDFATRLTKAGKEMATFKVTTYYGEESLVMFSRQVVQYKEKMLCNANQIMFFEVLFKLNDNGYNSFIVQKVLDPRDASELLNQKSNKVKIILNPQYLSATATKELVECLEENTGSKELYFAIPSVDFDKKILDENKKDDSKKKNQSSFKYIRSLGLRVSGSASLIAGVKDILGENSVTLEM